MKRSTLLGRLRQPAPRLAGFLLLAVTFLLVGVGTVLGQHGCPHHDYQVLEPRGAGPSAHEHGSAARERGFATHPAGLPAGGHDDAAAPHGEHHDDAAAPHRDGHEGPCTCIGTCHGSAATPLATSGTPGSLSGADIRRLSSASASTEAVPGLLPYLLPPSIGPPARV